MYLCFNLLFSLQVAVISKEELPVLIQNSEFVSKHAAPAILSPQRESSLKKKKRTMESKKLSVESVTAADGTYEIISR
jgi:hypothetical protein